MSEDMVQNAVSVLLLISAIFTCLALGVGLAYAACNLLFAGMRLRATSVASRSAAAKVAGTAQV